MDPLADVRPVDAGVPERYENDDDDVVHVPEVRADDGAADRGRADACSRPEAGADAAAPSLVGNVATLTLHAGRAAGSAARRTRRFSALAARRSRVWAKNVSL